MIPAKLSESAEVPEILLASCTGCDSDNALCAVDHLPVGWLPGLGKGIRSRGWNLKALL